MTLSDLAKFQRHESSRGPFATARFLLISLVAIPMRYCLRCPAFVKNVTKRLQYTHNRRTTNGPRIMPWR